MAAAPTPDARGFWVASTGGALVLDGDARSYGDTSGYALAAPVVGMAATPGAGYWMLGGDGGVFSFGDAGFYGSTGRIRLAQPALGIVATPTARGYWIVARDGGVFAFGDARFLGSTGGVPLDRPVVGMAATATGAGYWLAARDGGVFAFGDAGFEGSAAGFHLSSPVVALAATPDGGGYWLAGRDGGVFAFGDAPFEGSAAGGSQPAPVIGLVAAPDGRGYWIVFGNGQIEAFGDATPVASPPIATPAFSLVGQVIGIDPGHNGGDESDPAYVDQLVWNGTGWEPCDTTGTATGSGYDEAGFDFDVATRLAALLRSYGATMVMTRQDNTGVGPCVTTRAQIVNQAGPDAAVDIHADGGPPAGRGVTILEPLPDGPNDGFIDASDQLAVPVRDQFEAATGEPASTYDGVDGLQPRDDLAGLNLATEPKVLIECANMANPTDAALVADPGWRQEAAQGMAQGLSQFLIGYP